MPAIDALAGVGWRPSGQTVQSAHTRKTAASACRRLHHLLTDTRRRGLAGLGGLEGPEYLAWLGESPEGDYVLLMGANTYRLMYGFTKGGRAGDRCARVLSA
jgi:hypothetical protein